MAVISFDHVTGGYRSNVLFKDLNLVVEEGEFWAIIGPNGVGKSTLVLTILGLVPPISGTVYVFGCPAKGVCPHRRQIGYVPQVEGSDPSFPARVIDVVLTGLYGQIGLFRRVSSSHKRNAMELLEQVGLKEEASQPFGRLSVGQKKRVLIARALVGEPKALILDEPLAGLDLPSQERLIKLIASLKRQRKIPVIFVGHDLAFAHPFVDRVLLMGANFHTTGTKDILKDPKVLLKVYGRPVDLLRPTDQHFS